MVGETTVLAGPAHRSCSLVRDASQALFGRFLRPALTSAHGGPAQSLQDRRASKISRRPSARRISGICAHNTVVVWQTRAVCRRL